MKILSQVYKGRDNNMWKNMRSWKVPGKRGYLEVTFRNQTDTYIYCIQKYVRGVENLPPFPGN